MCDQSNVSFFPYMYLFYVFIFMSLPSAACLIYESGNVEIIFFWIVIIDKLFRDPSIGLSCVCSLLKCILNALPGGCVHWTSGVYCIGLALLFILGFLF